MDNNALRWLEGWFKETCDGDREHAYGIIIETIDNPGWSMHVDLAGTPLVDTTTHLPPSITRSDDD